MAFPSMSSPDPAPPLRKRGRLWRWLGRLLLLGVVLLAVLVVFHRPIIFWVLNRFGPQAAKMAGVELQWHASGSLWSDLTLDDVKARMNGYNVSVKHVALRYDLAPAWHKDWFKIPKAVVLHDVNATIDLREPSPPPTTPSKPTDRKALMDTLRQIALPDIDLQHVTVDVLMPDAALSVNDLSLNLPVGKDGTLHIASITHPAMEGMPVNDISAKLKLSPTALHITALRFPPDLEFEHLDVDASQFDRDRLVLGTKVRSGKAVFALDAATELRGDRPLVDLTADLSGLDQQSAGRWLASAPEWTARVNKLHVTAKGDVMNPRTLQAHVSLEASGLSYQQWKGDGVSTEINLANGLAEVAPLAVTAASNRIEARAKAQAPAKWEDFAHAPMEVHWQLAVPAPQDIAGLPVKLTGNLTGEGDAGLDDLQLRSFAAKVTGQNLALEQNRLRSLDVSAKGDLKAIVFDVRALADAGDGVLDSHGRLGLEAGAASSAAWNIVLPNPAALVRSLNLAWPADVAAGEVATEGAADFDLNKIKDGHYEDAKARGTLQAKDVAWKGAPCPLVNAAFALDHNKATISALDATLPSNNKVHVMGEGELSGERPFDASVTVDFADLPALQPWVDAASKPAPVAVDNDPSHAGAALLLGTADGKELLTVKSPPPPAPPPRLQGGKLFLAWHGNGSFKDELKLQGSASLKADKVRMDKLPDAVSLDLTATHDLEKAVVENLTGSLGPWAAKLKGTLGKTGIELTGIEGSNNGRRLISGALQVPLDLNAKPLPVDPHREVHLNLASEGAQSLSALAGYGKATLPPDLSGLVSATVAVNGSLPKLEANINIQATQLHLPKAPSKEPGSASFLLTLKDGVFNLDSKASVKPLNDLLVHASAKFDQDAAIKDPGSLMNTPFEATVKLHQPSLDFVKTFAPMLDEVRGSANIDLAARGTFKTPRISGLAVLDVPSVQPHDPDLPVVKNLKARIVADGTTVKLESLQALAAGGELHASGSCELKDMTKPQFSASLKAQDLLIVRNDNLSQRTDADLVCKGTPQAAALTGSVSLTRGRVFQEVNFLPINKVVNDLPPLPDAQARKAAVAAKAEASTSPLPPALAAWTFDVNLRTKDSVRLLGNVLNGGVHSDIHLGGTGAKPEVTGQANLEDAILNLPFSTLRVKEGIVTFEKDKPLAPRLELTAESSVDIYDIVLHGYGSALNPTIHFTSTPPLSEGDIASLLATGSTASGLQKAGDDTAGRALLFLARETYRRVFNSKAKPPKKGEKPSESRFIVQERSQDGALGGVTGTYEFNKKFKIVGSTNKEGSFRAMFQYLFHFD